MVHYSKFHCIYSEFLRQNYNKRQHSRFLTATLWMCLFIITQATTLFQEKSLTSRGMGLFVSGLMDLYCSCKLYTSLWLVILLLILGLTLFIVFYISLSHMYLISEAFSIRFRSQTSIVTSPYPFCISRLPSTCHLTNLPFSSQDLSTRHHLLLILHNFISFSYCPAWLTWLCYYLRVLKCISQKCLRVH